MKCGEWVWMCAEESILPWGLQDIPSCRHGLIDGNCWIIARITFTHSDNNPFIYSWWHIKLCVGIQVLYFAFVLKHVWWFVCLWHFTIFLIHHIATPNVFIPLFQCNNKKRHRHTLCTKNNVYLMQSLMWLYLNQLPQTDCFVYLNDSMVESSPHFIGITCLTMTNLE